MATLVEINDASEVGGLSSGVTTMAFSITEGAIGNQYHFSGNPVYQALPDRIGRVEQELSVGQQKILFDREATIDLYRQTITVPGADSCGCIYCKNFAAQRQNVFPAEFCRLLGELGVDPTKEWEAFEYNFDAKNPHKLVLYGGWFLFAGTLVEGAERRPDPQAGGFAHWFTSSFPTGPLPTGLKLCAIEFLVQIPWVLPEIPATSTNSF